MPGLSTIERIKENAEMAKATIGLLKNELNVITNEYNHILARQLREENARLIAAVEEAKKKLIFLECQNGIEQISVPGQKVSNESLASLERDAPSAPLQSTETTKVSSKPKKEKKPRDPKVSQTATEAPIDIGRLDLRIAKIEDVQHHPDADSLYVLKINAGEEHLRTVCSGLVKYVPLDDLKDRKVLLLCNLKPVKMRGIVSEAMVMCASSEKGVEVLVPPLGAEPGELVHCEGYSRQPDVVMNPKKKIFETVALHLHTNESLQACYKEVPLIVPGKGAILSRSLKQVPVK
ncbi:aaRS-interacting multifunctional protein 1 isoform X2 [Rhynchophorus ferrugineus]